MQVHLVDGSSTEKLVNCRTNTVCVLCLFGIKDDWHITLFTFHNHFNSQLSDEKAITQAMKHKKQQGRCPP